MQDDGRSRRIGAVLGPTLLAVTVSEWINFGIWSENDPRITYLNGMMLFAAGVAIIRFHSRRRPVWALSITVTGWLMAAGGLFRMFFPAAPQLDPGPAGYGLILLLGCLGAIMTLKSWGRQATRPR